MSNSGSPKNVLGALVLEGDQLAQDDARRSPCDSPPSSFELGLALVAGEVLDDRAQVLQVEQRQPGLVGEVEDQPERGLLHVVEAEHLGEQRRAERRHRRAQRHAGALPAEGEQLDREAGRRPRLADFGGARR